MQMEAVTIHYSSPFITVAVHVYIFSPKNFAAMIVLDIAILDLDILCTRRLIYYKAMTETRGAEMQMGAVTI